MITSKKIFNSEVNFLTGAASESGFPQHDGIEIALVGRSNVGKSSLLNALVGRKAMARVSHTPGRTQQLNFFQLPEKLVIVDLPGYGYSRVSKSDAANWQRLISAYLVNRKQLSLVFLLIDARRGIMESDFAAMRMFAEFAISFRIILTKSDKLKQSELHEVMNAVIAKMDRFGSCHPELLVTSSHKKHGILDVQEAISSVFYSANSHL